MTVRHYEIVFRRTQTELLALEALAARTGTHPALVQHLVEWGLLEPSAREGDQLFFDDSAVPRLRMIRRLREDLGINLAGVAVILDLRDKLCALQRENESYRSRL